MLYPNAVSCFFSLAVAYWCPFADRLKPRQAPGHRRSLGKSRDGAARANTKNSAMPTPASKHACCAVKPAGLWRS